LILIYFNAQRHKGKGHHSRKTGKGGFMTKYYNNEWQKLPAVQGIAIRQEYLAGACIHTFACGCETESYVDSDGFSRVKHVPCSQHMQKRVEHSSELCSKVRRRVEDALRKLATNQVASSALVDTARALGCKLD